MTEKATHKHTHTHTHTHIQTHTPPLRHILAPTLQHECSSLTPSRIYTLPYTLFTTPTPIPISLRTHLYTSTHVYIYIYTDAHFCNQALKVMYMMCFSKTYEWKEYAFDGWKLFNIVHTHNVQTRATF